MLRRGFRAVNPIAPLNHIQIDLKYATLCHRAFEHDCQRRFLTFSQKRSLR